MVSRRQVHVETDEADLRPLHVDLFPNQLPRDPDTLLFRRAVVIDMLSVKDNVISRWTVSWTYHLHRVETSYSLTHKQSRSDGWTCDALTMQSQEAKAMESKGLEGLCEKHFTERSVSVQSESTSPSAEHLKT